MFWCIIMSSNSKNCLQEEEEYSMSMIFNDIHDMHGYFNDIHSNG